MTWLCVELHGPKLALNRDRMPPLMNDVRPGTRSDAAHAVSQNGPELLGCQTLSSGLRSVRCPSLLRIPISTAILDFSFVCAKMCVCVSWSQVIHKLLEYLRTHETSGTVFVALVITLSSFLENALSSLGHTQRGPARWLCTKMIRIGVDPRLQERPSLFECTENEWCGPPKRGPN